MKKQYDVIIIGGGTAGLSAYRQAKQYQHNVLLVEKNHFKTTCANVGCMPSKLLISAAHNAHDMEKGKEFGVLWDNKKIDGKQVMKRVKAERDRFVGFVLEGVESIPDEDKLIGSATIINRNTVDVDGVKLTTKAIVIATGSKPVYPSDWHKLKDRLIINDDVFDWDDLPESVAVFGAGVIGLEIGQALHYLGVRVKLFSRGGRIAGIYDDDIRQYTINTINEEFYSDTPHR